MANTNDGAIWDNGITLSLQIGDEKYTLSKTEDKGNDKYPDWKGENCAAWDKVIKNGKLAGQKMLSISVGKKGEETQYVAFKNKFKNDDKQPDFNVLKSKPLNK